MQEFPNWTSVVVFRSAKYNVLYSPRECDTLSQRSKDLSIRMIDVPWKHGIMAEMSYDVHYACCMKKPRMGAWRTPSVYHSCLLLRLQWHH